MFVFGCVGVFGEPVLIPVLTRMNPEVQIIANSGLSTLELQEKAIAAGAKHFLAKPFTAELLLNTLDGALDAERSAVTN